MVEADAAVPATRRRSTTTSARRRCARRESRRSRRRRRGVQDRRQGRSRPSTNGRSSRMPAWARPAPWSTSRTARPRCWTGSQKPHSCSRAWRRCSACRPTRCASIWAPAPAPTAATTPATPPWTPPCCRRRSASRCAAVHARRGHRLGPEGPGLGAPARAALDAAGKVDRLRVHQQGLLARRRQHQRIANPRDTLAGQLWACRSKPTDGFRRAGESPTGSPTSAWRGRRSRRCSTAASPLRTSHLRDPVGPQIHFASESFIDEVAAATGSDPVEFRLHTSRSRATSR